MRPATLGRAGAAVRTEDPSPRFLVVEDSVSARRIIQDLLFQLGLNPQNLRLAGGPEEALRIAAEWSPELVFLDMELHPPGFVPGVTDPPPGPKGNPASMNGDDLGRELLRRNPELKIVVVTAVDPGNPRVQSMRRAGAEIVIKPVRAAGVAEVLGRLGYSFGH
jgi:CheY-like chemotaxis protein